MRIAIFCLIGTACNILSENNVEAASLHHKHQHQADTQFSQLEAETVPDSEMKTLPPSGDEPMSGPSSQDAGTINLVENERNMHLMPNPNPPIIGGFGRMMAPSMGSPAPYIAGLNASQSADYMFKLAHGLPLSAGTGGMLPPMMGGGMMPPMMAGGMMSPMMAPNYMGMPPPIMPAPVPVAVPTPVMNPLMGALNSYPMLGAAVGAMGAMGNLMQNFNGFGCGCNLGLNMPTGGCGCDGPSFPFNADPISYMFQWLGGSIGSVIKYGLAFYGFYLLATKDSNPSSTSSPSRRSRRRSSSRNNYDDRYDDDYAQTGVHHYDDESLTSLHSWERQLAQITKEWDEKRTAHELSQTESFDVSLEADQKNGENPSLF